MAKRSDNTFLLVAAALGAAFFFLFKPKLKAGPATSADGTTGGGVPGSPNQVVQNQAITSAQAQAAAREIAALGI